MRTARVLLAALAITAAAPMMAIAPPGADVVRVGSGAPREALNAMEFKPFNASLLGNLSGWTGGSALTASAIDGKPVLFFTWRSWHKVSFPALAEAQKAADKYGKNGLIVLGIHDARGFDKAAEVAKANNCSVPMAHDANGAFAAGLLSSHTPSFYVVDRAGNMRFADIDAASVDKALAIVTAETKEAAAALPAQLADAAAKADEDARKSKTLSGNILPGQILDVPFSPPESTAYESAKWPEKNTGNLSATDVQGKALPAALGSETWITEQPKSNGRVVVIDFWATWCGPCKRAMPKLDEMYKANKADLVIIGISDEQIGTVRSFLARNKHAYFQAVDEKRTVNKALAIQGIPHVIVMSTDGIIRWQGNPLDPEFGKAVNTVISVDPGVAARRKAEEEYRKLSKS